MNILYLAHRIPFPPDKGDKLRSFRQLEHLARRHRVWCACFVDDPVDLEYVEHLKGYCEDVSGIPLRRTPALLRSVAGLARGRTVTESFYGRPAMRAALESWCETVRFDVVVAFSSSMAPYALTVPADRRVLDLCDLDSQKWLDYAATSRGPARWLYRTEGQRLAALEQSWVDVFDASLLITEAETRPICDAAPSGKLHVVGNGVMLPDLVEDEDAWADASVAGIADSATAAAVQEGHARPPTLGFVGVMNYRPNIDAVHWFVLDCWQEIRAACPHAVFRIVGRSPTRRVRRLATVPGVEVVGGVDDLTPEVRRFDVSIAPMRIARGLQNKVLEAMAAARPVVLTSEAAEGIDARHEREYLIADRPAEFVGSIIGLLNDPEKRGRLGQAARRFVAVNHCWEEVLQRFELIVTGVLERAAPLDRLETTKVPIEKDSLAVPVGT